MPYPAFQTKQAAGVVAERRGRLQLPAPAEPIDVALWDATMTRLEAVGVKVGPIDGRTVSR